MYPTSAAFKEAVRTSHVAVIKAEVWDGTTKVLTLEPIDGQVEVDARRTVRRTCSVTVIAPDPTQELDRPGSTYGALAVEYATYADLAAAAPTYGALYGTVDDAVTVEVDAGIVPDSVYSALAPYGNEVRLWRGIRVEREVADSYADLAGSWNSYGALAVGSNAAPTTRTNLVTNPSFEVDTTGWSANAGSTRARTTADARFGGASCLVTQAGTAYSGIILTGTIAVTAGLQYTLSVYMRGVTSSQTLLLNVHQLNAGGAIVTQSNGGNITLTSSAGWSRYSVTFTAAATVVSVRPMMIHPSTATAGHQFYADAWLLEQESTLQAYFDGTSYGGTSNVRQQSWNGTANSSTSTLTTWGTRRAVTYAEIATATEATLDELVPLGVFLITDVDVTAGPQGAQVTVVGSDRSLRISRARWYEPYTVTTGTATETAIQTLLEDRWDDVEVDFTTTGDTVNRAVFGLETDNDPWKDAQKLAQASGAELFFDGDGIARLIPVRDYDEASPDAVYLENDEAMVLSLTRRLTSERTYNGVIAQGEGSESSATFRGVAWDEDPDSPTYRYGKFGEVPMFYSSPLLRSDDMALKAAQSILTKKQGVVESVDWSQIVDPSLDVGDVVQVVNADAKVDRLMVLDRLTIPLAATGTMQAVARTIRSLAGSGFEVEDE